MRPGNVAENILLCIRVICLVSVSELPLHTHVEYYIHVRAANDDLYFPSLSPPNRDVGLHRASACKDIPQGCAV